MAIQKLGLTRDQLASFLGDFEQIKQFEKLFATVNDVVEVDVEGTSIAAGNAQASANEALALIEAIKNSIEFVEIAQAIQNNNSTATDYVDFSTTAPAPAEKVGRVYWDNRATLGVRMTANVVGRVNEDLYYYIKASGAITKGQVIMFTGAVGSSGVPTGAPATGVTDGTYIMGVAAESIALNDFGLVQFSGTLKGIDTSAFVDGDILWYDPAVTGGFTKVKPLAPNIKVQMAAVINAGPGGSGSILIRVNAGTELGGTDSNVQFGTLADKDLIQYYGAGPYWRNVAYSNITVGYADNLTGGAANKIAYQTALNTTGFIDAPTVASTVLTWNGSAFTWTTPTTGTVTSVDVSGGTTGLTFSGGPITTSGTITMAGTLGVTNGGTGTSTALTPGSVVFAGTAGVFSQNNGAFFWDEANNRLGIGTNTPSDTLTVGGQITASGSVTVGSGQEYRFGTGGVRIQGDTSSDYMAFFNAGGTERMRLISSGDFGIGTTAPSNRLTVQDNTAPTFFDTTLDNTAFLICNPGAGINNFGASLGFSRLDSIGRVNAAIAIKQTTADSDQCGLSFFTHSSASTGAALLEAVSITHAGDVGIGVTAPAAKLNVLDAAPTDGIVAQFNTTANAAGTECGIRFQQAGSAQLLCDLVSYRSGTNAGVDFAIKQSDSSGVEQTNFYITEIGRVGIGTTAPATNVHVASSGNTELRLQSTSDNRIMQFICGSTSFDADRIYFNSGSLRFYAGTAELYRLQSTNHIWYMGGAEAMRLNSASNLGVGTSSPASKLHVNGDVTITDKIIHAGDTNTSIRFPANDTFTVETSGSERLRVSSAGYSLFGTTDDNINSGTGVKIRPGQNGSVAIVDSFSTNTSVGYSQYSTGAAAYRFYVDWSGTIWATSATISAISDIRLKENVRDLDAGLDTILALKPRRFDWKEGKGKDVKDDMGFIAQEVEEVLPELIGGWMPGEGEPDDLKSVKAGDLIPVLVKAIQELTARVEELERNAK